MGCAAVPRWLGAPDADHSPDPVCERNRPTPRIGRASRKAAWPYQGRASVTITDFHAKYIACELTRRQGAGGAERLAGAVASAQVDLNPHQVDAALFAFGSPLSKGALLADEVGLGKTIEAGLVIAQRWAENRRRILIITPSNLRKQWHQELSEKFFLPCQLIEARSFNAALRSGESRPFERTDLVIICLRWSRLLGQFGG